MEARPVLTGKEAVEAIRLLQQLGNSNARFDSRKLAQAIRTRAGRLKIMGGLVALPIRVPAFIVKTGRIVELRSGTRRSQRLRADQQAPDRPADSPEGERRQNGSYGLG